MTDKIEKILAFIDERIEWNEEMMKRDPKPSDIGRIEEAKCIRRFIESMQGETVSKVWHDASEEPEYNRPILVTTEYNGVFLSPNEPDSQGRGFSHYKKLSNYKKWAYVDDLLKLYGYYGNKKL